MSRRIVAYGYDRRAKVPAIAGTKVKLCPKCKQWFAARPRDRICDAHKTPPPESAVPSNEASDLHRQSESLKSRVSAGRKVTVPDRVTTPGGSITRISKALTCEDIREISVLAALDDSLTGVSFGCSQPRAQQAGHLPSARRHPFAGDRPEESGYCGVACNCKCHVAAYSAVMSGPAAARAGTDPAVSR